MKTIYVPETIYQKTAISVAVIAGKTPETGVDLSLWIAGIYVAVALILTWKFLSGLFNLCKLASQSQRIDMGHYTLLMLPDNQTGSSFSFFNWLFLSPRDYRDHADTVIRHEHEHIRQWHSVDVVVIELLKICFWFNPAIWLYKRSVETVHEYLADLPVPNQNDYASFLVAYAMRSPDIAIANHFFNTSLLKSRIQMIYKKRTSRWLLSRYFLILPVIGCSLAITASRAPLQSIKRLNAIIERNIRVKGNVGDETGGPVQDAIVVIAGTTRGASTDGNGWFELDDVPANAKLVVSHVAYETQEIIVTNAETELLLVMKKAVNKITGPVVVGHPIAAGSAAKAASNPALGNTDMKVAEQQPEFPGGREALMAYLLENLKYPEIARKTNVEAVALVSFTVDKNGEIRNAKSLKNIGYGIDKEALRVVNEMPRWNSAVQNGKPVEMEYTLEIDFKLEKNEADKRQGFLDFNIGNLEKQSAAMLSSMSEIGSFLTGSPNLSASGKAPELYYYPAANVTSRNPANEYMAEQAGKYRFLNYGGQYVKNPPYKWKKIDDK
ncbi:TonB family protein [Dyadobacter sp. CY261]|uniref:TonB family protein n=1 Tax=Dyadobacter sp. CY261 TaxID=2907203 RepID=UPI001F491538|nr:TonB family protein [Dyadobacter sp. CY261]MCF0071427.1 TonB family protein [Dyadobacter sp. CY261]